LPIRIFNLKNNEEVSRVSPADASTLIRFAEPKPGTKILFNNSTNRS